MEDDHFSFPSESQQVHFEQFVIDSEINYTGLKINFRHISKLVYYQLSIKKATLYVNKCFRLKTAN